MLQKKALLQKVTIVTFKEIETDPIKVTTVTFRKKEARISEVTTVTFPKSLEISTFVILEEDRHL